MGDDDDDLDLLDRPTITATGEPLPVQPPLVLERGAALGRYVVLERLGGGGMGVVYSAYDPELDRRVALKILRPDAVLDQSRLRREAQALARLQHPNVIAVHDVGRFHDRVFLAMELVEGVTLGHWLDERPRSWQEVVAMFRQAGAGLAAAHDVGMVHRDFTLANVLVGSDGRLRVVDFGLARSLGGDDEPLDGTDEAPSISPSSRPFQETLTRPGAVMGTPSYMSPEQFLGKAADPRSDQFNFCVAFYRALYGERPFAGKDLKEIAAEVTAGRLRPPPRDNRVPGWVRDIVLRGLASAPEQRWPSMHALLQALSADPAQVRRRRLLVAAIAVVAGVALLGVRSLERRQRLVCSGAEQKLAGVWDEARKREVHTAFAATGIPYAEHAFGAVARDLDAFAGQWVASHTDACRATRERREQSEELLDLRMECLGQRLQEVKAETDLFSHPDENVVRRAAQMTSSLPRLDGCSDIAALRAPVRPPTDAALRARAAEVRNHVEQGRALASAGKYHDGLPVAARAAEEARALKYRPLESYALYQLAWLQRKNSQPDAAAKSLDDAVLAARAGRDAAAEANAWALLVKVADKKGDYAQAHALARRGFAAIEAIESHDERPLLNMLESLGSVLYSEGKSDEALEYARRGLDIAERTYGRESTSAAYWLSSIALTLSAKGRYGEAEPIARRAVEINERLLGPQHPEFPDVVNALGETVLGLGRYDEALALYRRSVSITEKTLGHDDGRLVTPLYYVGTILMVQGKYDDALATERRALAIAEKKGPEHPLVAYALDKVGQVQRLQGHADEALASFGRAIAIWEKALGREHIELRSPLTGIGLVELDRHAPSQALAPLERARAIVDKHRGDGDPMDAAQTKFALARALAEAAHGGGAAARGGAEAHDLAVQARAGFVAAGPKAKAELSRLDAWLAAHPST